MPLIIHPSSCCDVCLEPLTYDEPRPPFAIPCGHIFCRECLYTMHPSICPLCRKPFMPDRSKKLITGEGAESDADRTAVALLQRLVVSWDVGVPEAERVALVGEVERWLGAGNTHEPLAKAHEVIRAYHILRSERHDNHRSIRHLRREIEQREIDQMVDKEHADVVEQSLLSQVQELHSKLARYEAEIEATRKAASTITFRKNPLPHPPEPYPLETLPSFAKRYSRNAEDATNGYPTTNGVSSSQAAAAPLPSAPALDDFNYPQQGVSMRIDRKGKSRATTIPLTPSSPGGRALSSTLPQVPASAPADDSDTPGPKNAIIPGASPNQRFVPRSVFENGYAPTVTWNPVSEVGHGPRPPPPGDPLPPVDPYTMAAEYVTQYVGGFGDGYRAVQRAVPPSLSSSSSRRSRPSRNAVTAPPDPIQSPLLEPPAEPEFALQGPLLLPGQMSEESRRRMEEFGQIPPPQAQVSNESRQHGRSSRRPRRLEDFYLGTAAPSSAHSNGRVLPPPSLSAPIQSEFDVNTRYPDSSVSAAIEESWGTRFWTQMAPSTSPVPMDPPTAPSTVNAQRPAQLHSQPVPRLSPPASAPPQPSSSSGFARTAGILQSQPQSQSSRHSGRSARHQRRMSDMTNIESSWRPPPSDAPSQPPPPDSGSSLRRRSALTGSDLTLHTPTGSDAASISSWGTVNTANPAPAATQPIRASAHFIPANDVISVRDLQLRSFEDMGMYGGADGDGERRSLVEEFAEMGLTPVELRMHGEGVRGGEGDVDHEREREFLNRTPRNRDRDLDRAQSPSLAESLVTPHPSDHGGQRERERSRDAHPGSYHNPQIAPGPENWYPASSQSQSRSQSHSHSYSQSHSQVQFATAWPTSTSTSTSSGHRSRSSRTRHHASRRLTPPNTAASILSEPPRASPSPSWESNGSSNALGLSDISPSPEPRISAPTPITSTRSFLRSFSHDSYR